MKQKCGNKKSAGPRDVALQIQPQRSLRYNISVLKLIFIYMYVFIYMYTHIYPTKNIYVEIYSYIRICIYNIALLCRTRG